MVRAGEEAVMRLDAKVAGRFAIEAHRFDGPAGGPPSRGHVVSTRTSKQLIAETRVPISMKAGRPALFDYEYERNGTANLFMMFAPLEGWRHVKVTDQIGRAHV